MRLWTMQPIEVYDVLLKDGVFRCDPAKIPEPSFAASYGWLIDKLDKKDKKPNNVQLPIWAWYRYDGKEKKPDLRHSAFGVHGEKMVCIELEIPENKVLLSDFDAWHYVLNDWWLDGSHCEEDWDKNHAWFQTLSSDEQNKIKVQSWEKIFDIMPYKNEWTSKGYYVQAVFWELKKEYIKKVQHFTAR